MNIFGLSRPGASSPLRLGPALTKMTRARHLQMYSSRTIQMVVDVLEIQVNTVIVDDIQRATRVNVVIEGHGIISTCIQLVASWVSQRFNGCRHQIASESVPDVTDRFRVARRWDVRVLHSVPLSSFSAASRPLTPAHAMTRLHLPCSTDCRHVTLGKLDREV